MIEVRPSERRDVNWIARRIRAVDRRECEAFGNAPKQSLRRGLHLSDQAWTAVIDGEPAAMFGVVVKSAAAGEGTPWLLGTDAVYGQARALLRWGPLFVGKMLDSTPRLTNLVSAENEAAIRLLKRWGFDVAESSRMVGGMAFRPFRMVR